MRTKKETYENVLPQIEKIVSKSVETIDKLEKICRLLQDSVAYFDWVGFYIWNEKTANLELGPFVGTETEHKIIALGKGICGQVAESKKTMIIQEVYREENYLSCSFEVQSEIVIPIFHNGNFVAELDIDSHSHSPFSEEDKIFLERICGKIGELF